MPGTSLIVIPAQDTRFSEGCRTPSPRLKPAGTGFTGVKAQTSLEIVIEEVVG
jgi:hypothetical protein